MWYAESAIVTKKLNIILLHVYNSTRRCNPLVTSRNEKLDINSLHPSTCIPDIKLQSATREFRIILTKRSTELSIIIQVKTQLFILNDSPKFGNFLFFCGSCAYKCK